MNLYSKNSQKTFEILESLDWSQHELGPIQTWPAHLIHFLNFIFNSKQACFLFWGEKAICFYNDSYIPVLGLDKHPTSMGKTADLVWPELWEKTSKFSFSDAMNGTASWNEDRLVPLFRNGKIDEAYFTYGYSPIIQDNGSIGGVLVTAIETTEKVQAKNKLLKSEARLTTAVEVTQLGFYDWDMKSDKVSCNEQMREHWGLTDESNFGDFITSIHPSDQTRVTETISKSIESKSSYFCKYRVLRGEEIVWIEAKGKIEYLENKAIRFIGTALNITEKENARLELEGAVSKLEEEKFLRERFVTALSHDLRTPLTSAKMSAQLLSRKLNDQNQILRINQIVNSMDRADLMIRDLLDVSRIRAGENIPIEISECDLNKILEETLVDLVSLYGERFEITTDDRIIGHWDRESIKRIIENFVSNAIKYGKDESIVTIGLNSSKTKGFTEISVHNVGSTLSKEDQLTIFEPFKRTHAATDKLKTGWGIGLTLVKEFAQAHGGSAHVSSTCEDGTTFSILIPQDSRNLNARKS